MLTYLVLILFTVTSRSIGLNCIHDFNDAEEAILNGSLKLLPSLSNAFYPTSERHTEYLVIRYYYVLNCSDGSSRSNYSHLTNSTLDYVWAGSSVYLVVEPNALEDFTCGLVDVSQGNLSINLQCLCPSYQNDIMAIISRLTAYLRCYAKTYARPSRDNDCKTDSFIRRYDSHNPLYKNVDDVINTIKAVSWISLILMLFLQFKALNALYTFILHNQKDWFSIAWATFFIGVVLLIIILKRDTDSELLDPRSITDSNYKDLYIGVYFTWFVGLLAALWFPKHARFPVPIITEIFCMLKMTNSRVFHMLTFIVQSLMIWILFCLIQLMTLHGIFFLVAVLARPVTVLITLAYVFTFIALAISGTSIMFEVVSLKRINPCRARSDLRAYRRDLLNIHTSMLFPIFIVALMFLSYQFGDKLGSTLDFTGTPAIIVGAVHSIVFIVLSIALRWKKFRQLFDEVKDDSRHKFVYNNDIPSEVYIAINDTA